MITALPDEEKVAIYKLLMDAVKSKNKAKIDGLETAIKDKVRPYLEDPDADQQAMAADLVLYIRKKAPAGAAVINIALSKLPKDALPPFVKGCAAAIWGTSVNPMASLPKPNVSADNLLKLVNIQKLAKKRIPVAAAAPTPQVDSIRVPQPAPSEAPVTVRVTAPVTEPVRVAEPVRVVESVPVAKEVLVAEAIEKNDFEPPVQAIEPSAPPMQEPNTPKQETSAKAESGFTRFLNAIKSFFNNIANFFRNLVTFKKAAEPTWRADPPTAQSPKAAEPEVAQTPRETNSFDSTPSPRSPARSLSSSSISTAPGLERDDSSQSSQTMVSEGAPPDPVYVPPTVTPISIPPSPYSLKAENPAVVKAEPITPDPEVDPEVKAKKLREGVLKRVRKMFTPKKAATDTKLAGEKSKTPRLDRVRKMLGHSKKTGKTEG